jgi:hypothetical protein
MKLCYGHQPLFEKRFWFSEVLLWPHRGLKCLSGILTEQTDATNLSFEGKALHIYYLGVS